jgi:hypothetical protein
MWYSASAWSAHHVNAMRTTAPASASARSSATIGSRVERRLAGRLVREQHALAQASARATAPPLLLATGGLDEVVA